MKPQIRTLDKTKLIGKKAKMTFSNNLSGGYLNFSDQSDQDQYFGCQLRI